MREIKFCGKRINDGKWVYGYYHYREREKEHIISYYEHSELLNMAQALYGDKKSKRRLMLCMPEVDPKTLGQYIGLRDRKRTKEFPDGEMIYENDIVNIYNGIYEDYWQRGIIVLRQGLVGACEGDNIFQYRICKNINLSEEHDIHNLWNAEDIEKIGNKFDNPELMKERTGAFE